MSKGMQKKARTNYGYCNICNQFKELTFDHVPSKGSIELKPVEIGHFIDKLVEITKQPIESTNEHLKNRIHHRQISQNGIKFRTICANCNNALL